MKNEFGQVTILPAQFSSLAFLSQQLNCAFGVSQTGSVLHINTGNAKFDINSEGNVIRPPNQETLC